ncbi:MAG: hypothetical protein K8F36_03510 [Melioribacteraceae bacterium]|nr:hypothetical protein [Melioribacteraceae bacterium]
MKLKLFAILFIVLVLNIFAQPRFDPKEQGKELKQLLTLNDDQTREIEIILTEMTEEMKKLRENNTGNREEMFPKMMKIREEANKKIEILLDKDQKKKFKKYLEELEIQKRKGFGPGRNK